MIKKLCLKLSGDEKGAISIRPDIVPGALFPDYELTDHTAKRRELSELQGSTKWSYSPRRFLSQGPPPGGTLVQFHREMEVGYCRLVTISMDKITLTNEYRWGVGAHWLFLSDAGRSFTRTSTLSNTPIENTIR